MKAHLLEKQIFYQVTLRWFLLLTLVTTTAFAQEWVDESRFAPVIQQELEKGGERISGLDNMISPAARRYALESQDSPAPRPDALQSRDSEAPRPNFLKPQINPSVDRREVYLPSSKSEAPPMIDRERSLRTLNRAKIENKVETLEKELRAAFQRSNNQPMELQKESPLDDKPQKETLNLSEPRQLASEEESPSDEVSPREEKSTAPPKQYGYWDKPLPEPKTSPAIERVESRSPLTERPVAAAPLRSPQSDARVERYNESVKTLTPVYVPSSQWDELNTARERARLALAESFQSPSEPNARLANDPVVRKYPINLPTQPNVRRVDELSDEIRAVERSQGLGTEKLLVNVQRETDRTSDEAGLEDVPLLRPRYRIKKEMNHLERKSLAVVLAKNGYARGSRPSSKWRESEATYQAAKLPTAVPRFYRHLSSDLSSKPRGQNVRVHSVMGEE